MLPVMATTTIKTLPNDDTTNGWANILPERVPNPPLAGDVVVDWAVIGAGFAGLAAARRLAENRPNDAIALIDAQRVGDGASARNSGFVIDLAHNVGSADQADLAAARRSTRLSRTATQYLDDIVTANQIQCDWSHRGQHMSAVSGLGEAFLEGFTEELDALGEPYRVLDSRALAGELGTGYFRAAVHTPGTILMQPAALVRGLGDTLPSNVTVYEQSPVTAIDYGDPVKLTTAGGTLTAAKIILAVNGFAPGFDQYRGKIFPIRAFASLTRQLTDAEVAALGGHGDWGVVPTNAFAGATLRHTRDNRLLFRQNIGYATRLSTDRSAYETIQRSHLPLFRARYPMLPDVTFDHTWVGFLCMSRNFAPGFSQPAANVYTAVCQNAVGATKGTIAGMLAADLACGVDNPLIADMDALGQPERLPPRPFLDIGAWAAVKWWGWQGRSER